MGLPHRRGIGSSRWQGRIHGGARKTAPEETKRSNVRRWPWGLAPLQRSSHASEGSLTICNPHNQFHPQLENSSSKLNGDIHTFFPLGLSIAMSARLLSSSRGALTRRPHVLLSRRLPVAARPASSFSASTSAGLLRIDSVLQARRPGWPIQAYRYHNSGVVAVRSMSFARALPKLVLKLARVPAAFGGVMIAGLAYVQYQAQRQQTPLSFFFFTFSPANIKC